MRGMILQDNCTVTPGMENLGCSQPHSNLIPPPRLELPSRQATVFKFGRRQLPSSWIIGFPDHDKSFCVSFGHRHWLILITKPSCREIQSTARIDSDSVQEVHIRTPRSQQYIIVLPKLHYV